MKTKEELNDELDEIAQVLGDQLMIEDVIDERNAVMKAFPHRAVGYTAGYPDGYPGLTPDDMAREIVRNPGWRVRYLMRKLLADCHAGLTAQMLGYDE